MDAYTPSVRARAFSSVVRPPTFLLSCWMTKTSVRSRDLDKERFAEFLLREVIAPMLSSFVLAVSPILIQYSEFTIRKLFTGDLTSI